MLVLSCKNTALVSKNQSNQKSILQESIPKGEEFCNMLKKMNSDDQKYRSQAIDPFFEILDSIQKAEGLSDDQYISLPEKTQLEYGRRARAITNQRIQGSKSEIKRINDSLMSLQAKLDNKNTELLIKIIKKQGWPNKENTLCKEFTGLIFVHSQEQYWDEIRELSRIEFKANRMDIPSYKGILYHINGRDPSFFNMSREMLEKQQMNLIISEDSDWTSN